MMKRITILGLLFVVALLVGHFWRSSDGLPPPPSSAAASTSAAMPASAVVQSPEDKCLLQPQVDETVTLTDSIVRPDATGIMWKVIREELTAAELAAPMPFQVVLKMRNMDELRARVAKGEILSSEEMAARYYPTTEKFEQVAAWLGGKGLSVQPADITRLSVIVQAATAATAQVLHTKMVRVLGYDGKEYTSAITPPVLPGILAPEILHVGGLQPQLQARIRHAALPVGYDSNSFVGPQEIAKLYGVPATGLDGTGQTIAIIIQGIPLLSDLTTFWTNSGVSQTVENFTIINPGWLDDNRAPDLECTMDVEWAGAIAPKAKIRLYASPATWQWVPSVLSDLAAHPGLHQVSMSYGYPEHVNNRNGVFAESQYYAALAAAGISVFGSSGDWGGYSPHDGNSLEEASISVLLGAADPSVTSVGGTNVVFSELDTESGWGRSGGGASMLFPRPSWQTGIWLPDGAGRLVPDVAAIAASDNRALYVCLGGATGGGGGTSISSPIWAGLCALINQARANNGQSAVGLLGPRIYPLRGSSAFNDIVATDSNGTDYPGATIAGPGWDRCTGLGTPNLGHLIEALAGTATPQVFAPKITAQSGDQTAFDGGTVTLSVAATTPSDSPILSYQWQVTTSWYEGLGFGNESWLPLTDGADVSGANTAEVTFKFDNSIGTRAAYQCVVQNQYGCSYTAAIHIRERPLPPTTPSFITQPVSQTVEAGDTAIFSATATGGPATTYQWQKDGVKITGAVLPTLVLPNVQVSDAGEYRMIATNQAGSATSDKVTLTVNVPPAITTQPVDAAVLVGTTVTFSVAASGIPAPTYQWYINGKVAAGQTAATFTPFVTTNTDNGSTFHCIVSNSSGTSKSRSATLTVVVPAAPIITAQPADVVGEIGTRATFTVAATGVPAPSYRWLVNGQPAADQRSASFLPFTIAGYHGGWTFSCVVTNAWGSATSRAATLTVGSPAPPVITSQPRPAGVVIGQSGSISLTAMGAIGYQWFKGGVAVTGATGVTLDFPALGSADAGIYDCAVTGLGGETLSVPVVVGVVPAAGERTAGSVTTRPEWQGMVHPKGAVYDQFLLAGAAGTFTASGGKIARCSYIDEDGSIVQVEMSGAGAITIVLAQAQGPMAPALYNQVGIEYMKGKATVILSGADETTHFTIYSVGTATNPGVTRPDVTYAGWANVAAAGILSTTGGLGGIHQGNVGYQASTGPTGLYAPTVTSVGGLVVVHGIQASESAQPYLFFGTGGTADIKIAGTSLAQPNTDDITVRGLSKVTMGAGQDSCGRAAPALAIQGALVNEVGANVTASLVVGP